MSTNLIIRFSHVSLTNKFFSSWLNTNPLGWAKHLNASGYAFKSYPSKSTINTEPIGFCTLVSPNGPESVKYIASRLDILITYIDITCYDLIGT